MWGSRSDIKITGTGVIGLRVENVNINNIDSDAPKEITVC